jgi:hypothetical protein
MKERPALPAPEERSPQSTGLRRGQFAPSQDLYGFVRDLALRCGEWGRVALPTETRLDIGLQARGFPRDLVRLSVQVSNLLEQRLELFLVDRHAALIRRINQSFLPPPFVFLEQNASEL